ncbi:MAG: hypothetical protein AAB736_01275 [Patescibacteria group bacterium]
MKKDGGNDALVGEVIERAISAGGVVIVAGALEPECEMTNLALLLASPGNKVTVMIKDMPYGPGIPEEIRKGWIGVVISGAHGPFTTGTSPLIDKGLERTTFTEGYAVGTLAAMESLRKVNMDSWWWFVNKKLPEYLFFNEECCQIIT